jgi:hypothetical protein
MDHDEAKDYVLQYLLSMQRQYPNRHIGYPKAMIVRAVNKQVSPDEYKSAQSMVNLAVDYLYDEGFLKTQSEEGTKFYRLSSKAQDRLLAPSAYSKQERKDSGIRVMNNDGVMVFGDNYGSVSIDKRVTITNELEKIAKLIENSQQTSEEQKADYLQSIATIQAQLKKPEPDKTIVSRAWQSLQAASTIAGTAEFIKLIAPVIMGVI